MKFKFLVIMLALTACMGSSKPTPAKADPYTAAPAGMTFDTYLAQVKQAHLVLVDFNATWCGPCKTLKPIVQKVIRKNGGRVILMDVDVDQNPVVANTMNIKAIPLLILYKDGKEVWRNMGLTDEQTISDKIDFHAKS